MSSPTLFIVKNQLGQFLNKHNEWIDGVDAALLYRTTHRDEAVNTVFEVSSKDIYLRAEVVACSADAKGQPLPRAIATGHANQEAEPTEPAADETPVTPTPAPEIDDVILLEGS